MNVLHDYRHETIYVTTTVQIELEKNNTRIKTKVQSAFVIKDMLLVLENFPRISPEPPAIF